MVKKESTHITGCTISWENTEDILSVVTKVLQTEIQVRLYNAAISLKGTVNTDFAAIFITLNGSGHIVKLLMKIVSINPYNTHCVNGRCALSYTQ